MSVEFGFLFGCGTSLPLYYPRCGRGCCVAYSEGVCVWRESEL